MVLMTIMKKMLFGPWSGGGDEGPSFGGSSGDKAKAQ